MTLQGWAQIALYAFVVVVISRPLGGYMTRVYNGERTLLTPLLQPVERLLYRAAGVDETREQNWVTYAFAMLFFSIAGFVTLYLLQRLQGYLPLNPQERPNIEPSSAFNTAISFVSNTNWQSYKPEATMGYLVHLLGDRFDPRFRAPGVQDGRQFLGGPDARGALPAAAVFRCCVPDFHLAGRAAKPERAR
jgi:K+-transporting ATPase ATPase A chain